MFDYKDLESDAARRLFFDLKIAFWERAKHSAEENQRIVKALRKKYDAQHGEGASERDLGLLPFPSQAESVTKEVEALEQPEEEQIPAGYESWFRPASAKKQHLDWFYTLAGPALRGEEDTQASTQADINDNLLAECSRLYLIDARTNPKAAEEFSAISSVDDMLQYIADFPGAWDEGYTVQDMTQLHDFAHYLYLQNFTREGIANEFLDTLTSDSALSLFLEKYSSSFPESSLDNKKNGIQ